MIKHKIDYKGTCYWRVVTTDPHDIYGTAWGKAGTYRYAVRKLKLAGYVYDKAKHLWIREKDGRVMQLMVPVNESEVK